MDLQKIKLRDCLAYLKNNYSDDIDTMDSIIGLEQIINQQAETIEQQQREIEQYRYQLGLRSDYKGE